MALIDLEDSISPISPSKLTQKQREFVKKIRHVPDEKKTETAEKYLRPAIEKRADNIFFSGLENLEGLEGNASFYFASTHETHKDYVEQQLVLLHGVDPFPAVGAGEQLYNVLGPLSREFFKTFAYMVLRRRYTKEEMQTFQAYKTYELARGQHLLEYPGGGLSKNGEATEFQSPSFEPVIAAQKLANAHNLPTRLYVVPTIIRHEIVTDFPTYHEKESWVSPIAPQLGEMVDSIVGQYPELERKFYNKDMRRWLEIYLQSSLKKKGSTFIYFLKPIDIQSFLEKNDKGKPGELREKLSESSYHAVLGNLPLLSTDLVAYAIRHFIGSHGGHISSVDREILDMNVASLSGHIKKYGVHTAENIKDAKASEITDMVIDLSTSQRKPFLSEGKNGQIQIVRPELLQNYADRARQLLFYKIHGNYEGRLVK